MAKTVQILSSILACAAFAAAPALAEEAPFRLRGQDDDGRQLESALAVRPGHTPDTVRVLRVERDDLRVERRYVGTGVRVGDRLRVELRDSSSPKTAPVVGLYMLGPSKILGVLCTKKGGRTVWTEESGFHSGRSNPWASLPATEVSPLDIMKPGAVSAERRPSRETPQAAGRRVEDDSVLAGSRRGSAGSRSASAATDTERSPRPSRSSSASRDSSRSSSGSRDSSRSSSASRDSSRSSFGSSPSSSASRSNARSSRSSRGARSSRSRSRSSRSARSIAEDQTPVPPPLDATQGTGPDARLARLQVAAVEVAREELARRVIESPLGSNRAPRIDLYAETSGMRVGQAWCGFFITYAYVEAARRAGLEFAGRHRLHSVGKARSFFNYRVYTQRATSSNIASWEQLRSDHSQQDSTRRYFTFRDSYGDDWAKRRGLPHMVYTDAALLPIRAGDTVIFTRATRGTKNHSARGHLGLVEHYDRRTKILTTIEGNTSSRVRRKTYNLGRASVRAKLDGFARPALGDFAPAER